MEEIASNHKIDFILNTGDNFQNMEGRAWEANWGNVYKRREHLKGLTWYGVVGNRDYAINT